MLKIAIVSDDAKLTDDLAAIVRDMGHAPVVPEADDSPWLRLRSSTVQAAVVDAKELASADAAAVRQIRKDESLASVPILMLVSAKALARLDPALGFDDFACRDDPPERIASRLRFLLWRRLSLDAQETIRVGSLVIDTARYEVMVGGNPIDLTYKEYELLRFLASNPNRAFSRSQLLDRVWGSDYFGGERTVDVHVRRLRFKLGGEEGGRIETVRNVGYKFRRA